jgi:hypothetical protein
LLVLGEARAASALASALLREAESAPRVVAGRVETRQQLDAQGWLLTLKLRRVLRGPGDPGTLVRVAWEEPAPGNEGRFRVGEQLLLALAPLPAQSLWTQRLPERDAWFVAARGAAFLRAPDEVTLHELARWLALPAEERRSEQGVELLLVVATGPSREMGLAALDLAGAAPGLASQLNPRSERALTFLVGEPERFGARSARAAEVVGARRLARLRPPIAAQARPGSPIEEEATRALAELDGGLDPERVRQLLSADDAHLRALGVEFARGTDSEAGIGDLIASDPAPEVRAAAVDRWITWRGLEGLPQARTALLDADRRVRARAILAVGGLGGGAVFALREMVEGHSASEAVGAVGALRLAGPEGLAALREIEATTEDPDLARLIRAALGEAEPRH